MNDFGSIFAMVASIGTLLFVGLYGDIGETVSTVS